VEHEQADDEIHKKDGQWKGGTNADGYEDADLNTFPTSDDEADQPAYEQYEQRPARSHQRPIAAYKQRQ